MSHFKNRTIPLLICVLLIGAGLLSAQTANQVKQTPPIQLGTSGGNVNDISTAFCCSGTLGSLVASGTTQYILSNNHVLADTNTGHTGDPIIQPGLADVGCNTSCATTGSCQNVASLSTFVPLGTSNVDAAIAQVISGQVDSGGSILEVGVPANTQAAIDSTAIGRGVAKSGRTTGLTCANLSSINTNVRVQYQTGCGSGQKFFITYTNQIAIQSAGFSAGGDSGSLIVTSDTTQPIGLLFAGSDTVTIGNRISDVISAFSALGVNLNFVGDGTHAVTCPTGGGGGGSPPPSPDEVERATEAKERHAQRLMTDPAIMGVGVGVSEQNPSEAVVVIYVEQGRPHGPIPQQLDAVRTRVIRTSRIRAYGWNELKPKACSMR